MHRLLTGPLTLERVVIPITGLSSAHQGLRLVQLSDFHWDGLRLSPWLLHQAIDQSNAIDPDLVVLTGDFVTWEPTPIDELAAQLVRLTSRYGIYAVLGNHDNLSLAGRQRVQQGLQQVGIQVLWNQVAYPLGPDLPLVGLADLWSRDFAPAPLFEALAAHLPRIVLCHNPDGISRLQHWRVDLQLSGHTHGGQIIVPGLGPIPKVMGQLRPRLPAAICRWIPYLGQGCDQVVHNWEWAAGLYRLGRKYLYVNRGLGTYLPGRLFCPPEVTQITLTRAPD